MLQCDGKSERMMYRWQVIIGRPLGKIRLITMNSLAKSNPHIASTFSLLSCDIAQVSLRYRAPSSLFSRGGGSARGGDCTQYLIFGQHISTATSRKQNGAPCFKLSSIDTGLGGGCPWDVMHDDFHEPSSSVLRGAQPLQRFSEVICSLDVVKPRLRWDCRPRNLLILPELWPAAFNQPSWQQRCQRQSCSWKLIEEIGMSTTCEDLSKVWGWGTCALSGLPHANAKSQRFSFAISQAAPLPPVIALNRSSKSQIAARHAAFWHAISQIALAPFL